MEGWRRGRVNGLRGKWSQGTHSGSITIWKEGMFESDPHPSIYTFSQDFEGFKPLVGALAPFTQFLAPLGVLSFFEGF